ncbi:MAG: serine/threonine protein kinase [Ruminococcaceae bacterium]|nr:serine/threonine protein kinase [Oscillospiraceae bacterium]
MTRAEYLAEILTQYDVVRVLSNKNDAEILRIRHKKFNRDIVLRSYLKPVLAYKKLKSITHRNIPTVYDTLNFDDGQIVLEEFIDGITVAEVLEQGKYTYHGAKKIILAVCDALLVLRDMDIVHRDIKPENIMVTRSGDVQLIDFNAARIHKNEKQKDTVILGTIGYAPPEQYGISQSDEKSDIYSLGVLLNVMLTGTHPSRQLARGKAGKIVLKCTQIDPNHRFDNIESLIVKL